MHLTTPFSSGWPLLLGRLLPLLALTLCLSACLEDRCSEEITYQVYEAVTVEETDWRTDNFAFESPHDICEPSGFYVYGDLLFVVDRNAGVHIIDNSDSANPRPVTFLKAVGGQGIAVRNNILYLSQFTDIVTFDLGNPRRPEFLERTRDAFEARSIFANLLADGMAVLEYVPTDETITRDCDEGDYGYYYYEDRYAYIDVAQINGSSSLANDFAGGDLVGIGGSLARFTISNGTLYTVDNRELKAFSLGDPAAPAETGTVELGWDIETIFPYQNYLYIGSQTGMHIVDATEPLAPVHISTFRHVRSCDPVVVQNDVAYVTMWGGSDCGSQANRLEVINVANPAQPTLIQTMERENSHGLAVTGDKLFLCSAEEGLAVMRLGDDGRVLETTHRQEDFNAWDVIALPATQQLIVFGQGKEGIQQYDYADDGRLTPTSHLDICQ